MARHWAMLSVTQPGPPNRSASTELVASSLPPPPSLSVPPPESSPSPSTTPRRLLGKLLGRR